MMKSKILSSQVRGRNNYISTIFGKITGTSPKAKETYRVGSLAMNRGISSNDRSYKTFAKESFMYNVVCNRAISMIAISVSSVQFNVYQKNPDGSKVELKNHPICDLLQQPSPQISGTRFLCNLMNYFLIAGNCYVYASKRQNGEIEELQILRPDRIEILPLNEAGGYFYRYSIDNKIYDIYPNLQTGISDLLHVKRFHPLDDLYGLSCLESAHFAVEQHNECMKWNKSLLSNGGRPSGAIVIKNDGHFSGSLTDEQFDSLKSQINDSWSGSNNAGKVMILEGGMEWQEMNMSPKDMDFIETKNSASRDIALAIGVPPQLLGIKGDNTYSNLAEARLAFWEETIIPYVSLMCDEFSNWFSMIYGENIEINYNPDTISAINEKREAMWNHVKNTDFMTLNEKRELLGISKQPTNSQMENFTSSQNNQNTKVNHNT